MSKINEPFPIFYDDDGTPLDNGMIYVGAVGQNPRSNPVQVYYDAALTIPAAQPIRTLGGRPAYQGAPARLYIAQTEYSIEVQNRFGTPVTGPTAGDVITAADVSFLQSGIGAVERDVQAKLRETVSVKDFGAVGDGVADDRAALLSALQSGSIVDGMGHTYAVSDEVKPSSFRGLRNATLKWTNTTTMAQQKALLFIENLSNWFVENVTFDMGTVENTGSADDSTRCGFKTTTTSPNVTFNDGIRIEKCRVFGHGNGTGIYVRSCRNGIVANNIVQDRNVAFSPDPSNDCQNGIDVSQSLRMKVYGNEVSNLRTRLSGNLTNRFSRGLLFFEVRDSSIYGNTVDGVDQAFDFSGAWDAVTNTNGNVNLTVTGNTTNNTRSYGFKFANVARDITVTGNTAKGWGISGFVFSPSSVTIADPSKNTQRITVVGNTACDPTNAAGATNRAGFYVANNGTYQTYPRGVRLIGNIVSDSTGGGLLTWGYRNDVVYDGSSGLFNELVGCRASGFVTGFSDGNFPAYVCSLSGGANQSLASSNTTNVLWPVEISDLNQMHSTVTNTNLVTVPATGWYMVSCVLSFASNSTGFRRLRILKNGVIVPGGQVETAAVSGAQTAVSASVVVQMAVGDTFSIQATQNSGGNLDLVLPDCRLDVRLLDAS